MISVANDTFASISSRARGIPDYAGQIRAANPWVSEPIPAGVEIYVPPLLGGTSVSGVTPSGDKIDIVIAGGRVEWRGLSIQKMYDGISGIKFSCQPIDILPFEYQPIEVYLGGGLFFSGVVMDIVPVDTVQFGWEFQITGYARPGVLQDCPIVLSDEYGLQYDYVPLKTLVEVVIQPFGLTTKYDSLEEWEIPEVVFGKTEKVFDGLTRYAKVRGFYLSNTDDGQVLVRKPVAVASGRSIDKKKLVVNARFNGREYYSGLLVSTMALPGLGAESVAVQNPYLTGIQRILTQEIEGEDSAELELAGKARLGQMFGSAIKYDVDIIGWTADDEVLVNPGDTVKFEALKSFVLGTVNFFVRGVRYDFDTEHGQKANLECILPEAFLGEVPAALPWKTRYGSPR